MHGNHPDWKQSKHSAGKIGRILAILQILAAMVLGCVIWIGVEKLIQ